MSGRRYTFIHGLIEGFQPYSTGEGYLLRVLRADGQTILMTTFMPDWNVQTGNEISIAVKNSNPSHAVAMIDHTAGERERFCRALTGRRVGRMRSSFPPCWV